MIAKQLPVSSCLRFAAMRGLMVVLTVLLLLPCCAKKHEQRAVKPGELQAVPMLAEDSPTGDFALSIHSFSMDGMNWLLGAQITNKSRQTYRDIRVSFFAKNRAGDTIATVSADVIPKALKKEQAGVIMVVALQCPIRSAIFELAYAVTARSGSLQQIKHFDANNREHIEALTEQVKADYSNLMQVLKQQGITQTPQAIARKLLEYHGYGYTKQGLMKAVRQDDLGMLRLYTLAGAGVNFHSENEHKHTPLIAACYKGSYPVTAFLLQRGAQVNTPDAAGITPLMAAAWQGDCRIAELLIARGAKVDQANTTRDRTTALWFAAHRGHFAMVRLLVENGADKNSGVTKIGTPMYAAHRKGHRKIVDYLLSQGAHDIIKEKAITEVKKSSPTVMRRSLLDPGCLEATAAIRNLLDLLKDDHIQNIRNVYDMYISFTTNKEDFIKMVSESTFEIYSYTIKECKKGEQKLVGELVLQQFKVNIEYTRRSKDKRVRYGPYKHSFVINYTPQFDKWNISGASIDDLLND